MRITAGSRWRSVVCATEVVVVKAPSIEGAMEGELTCGGEVMRPAAEPRVEAGAPRAGHDGGTLVGKRYGDDAAGFDALCTRGGAGALAFAGRLLEMRDAKKLPSSD